jgi:predicted transposase YbfD/YdcC
LDLNAAQTLYALRSHWKVENMHWVFDITFRGDESRIWNKRGPLAFNVMQKIAMALFKQDDTK